MPDLDPIIQEIVVNGAQAIGELKDFAEQCLEDAAAANALNEKLAALTAWFAAAAGRVNDFRNSLLELAGMLSGAGDEEERLAITAGEAATATDVQASRVNDLRNSLAAATVAAGMFSHAEDNLRGAMGTKTAAVIIQDNRVNDLRNSFIGTAIAAESLVVVENMMSVANLVNAATMNTASKSAQNMRRWWFLSLTALHWIVAGTAELAAVLIPATVAAAAWAFVWLQGATNVQQHMTALFDATEAMGQAAGQTTGEMLGLSGAFQRAQNAANVQVYQAWGSAVDILRESFGGLATTGLEVGTIFDAFMGKLAFDFSSAGDASDVLNNVLAKMIPDLIEVGQFFGNLGHALALVGEQMPGLAEVMLGGLAVITHLIVAVLNFTNVLGHMGIPILTAVIALEEFQRWGGLFTTMMIKMGVSVEAATGKWFGWTRTGTTALAIIRILGAGIVTLVSGIGVAIRAIPIFAAETSVAGNAMIGFAAKIQLALDAMTPFQAVLILAAAVLAGYFIYKMITATTAAQKFTDALQKSVEVAKGWQVFTVIGNNIGELSRKIQQANDQIAQQTAQLNHLKSSTNNAAEGSHAYTGILANQENALNTSKAAVATYAAEIVKETQQSETANKNAQMLAKTFGISVPGAVALAAEANVSLTGVLKNQKGQWTALGQQILGTERGFQNMGATANMVGSYMQDIAVSEGLAGTKMQTVNQAIDQFVQNLTGGTSGMSQFEESLQNIGTIAADTANHLGSTNGQMTLTTSQFAHAMKTDVGIGAQAWSNFDQLVGSTVPQLTDWLRTAGTEGALSFGQVKTGILSAISQLLPYAKDSKTAQATILGLAQANGIQASTYPELVKQIKDAHDNQGKLNQIVDQGTTAMANLSKIAQNMGDVLSGQVTSALSQAALKASGFYTAETHLADALNHGSSEGKNAAYWARVVAGDVNKAGQQAQTAANKVGILATNLSRLHSKTIDVTTVIQTIGGVGTAQTQGESGHKVQADAGALLPPGMTVVHNQTSGYEAILTPGQLGGLMNQVAGGSGGGTTVHVHVGGSTFGTMQDITRAVQTGLNQKTLRNGSTQAFISGRKH
jgi:hypothetical protein